MRTRIRSGKGTLSLQKKVNDNWVDHSCDRMVDTQKKIIELLGMDCSTFQSCVLIMQDRYGVFMEASKEERMAVLANLLGLGIYDELEKLTKESMRDVNRDIRNLKADVESLETAVSEEDTIRSGLHLAESQLKETNNDLQEARKSLEKYRTQMAQMESYQTEAEKLKAETDKKKSLKTSLSRDKDNLESQIEYTNSFLEQEEKILQACRELEAAKLQLAAMDGKIKLLHDKKARCQKVGKEKHSAIQLIQTLQNKISYIYKSIKERDKLEAYIEGNTIEQDLERMENKARAYRELEKKLSEAKYRKTELLKQVDMLENTECIDIEKAQCRFLKAAKKAKTDLKSLQPEIDLINNEINLLNYHPELHNVMIQEARTYREAKDRLTQMTADATICESLRKQELKLQQTIDEYDTELKQLNSEIAQLESETAHVNELKEKIKQLAMYEEKKMQLPKAKQFLENASQQIEKLNTDITELQESVNQIEARIAELYELMKGKKEIEESIDMLDKATYELEGHASELNKKIGSLTAKLETICKKKQELFEKKKQLSDLADYAAKLSTLADAFGQDGIPYQIIRDIVPELEASANEILSQMTGGRMRLEFVTEKVLKSNKNKEVATLDIIITDVENGVLPYLSRSGGQKVRAALANSFALAMIKASRIGLKLGMMFVDEPPYLDAEGTEAYCAALAAIHEKYPGMRILAISHDENMKSNFPQQLFIEVTENGSKVRRS